tara:strand:- start:105 stop:446 length:342 start_codon:yes stop_codon:yes gene_type:complete
MKNPFELIDARLSSIEDILLEIKLPPKEVEPNETPEQFITIQEAAQFLKLTVPTLYSKVSRRELPVMKRGNRLYFSKYELIDYLKQGRKKSNFEIEQAAQNHINRNQDALSND